MSDDGLDAYLDDSDRLVARVLVARVIDNDGELRDILLADDGTGGDLDSHTAVGMLAAAQHQMLCDCLQREDDDR